MGSEFLAPLQHRIEQALTTSLSQPTASHYLTEAMRYATLNGGKRLRASLVYMGCEALEIDLELGTAQALRLSSFMPIRLFMTTFPPWTMMI